MGAFSLAGAIDNGVMHMKVQRGQTMVEFALIAPMIFLMIFGMIWGGFMFMEYLRFSNDVRAAARDIAITGSDDRSDKITAYRASLYQVYEENLPKLYKPDINIIDDDVDVTVTVTFTRRNDLPAVLMWVNFPPDKIPAIKYKMLIEGNYTNSPNVDDSNTSGEETSTSGGG